VHLDSGFAAFAAPRNDAELIRQTTRRTAVLTRPDKVKLHTLLGSYPNVVGLKDGRITSDLIEFDFPDFPVPNRGFKPMVREHRFDCGELAIVTFLQAKSFGFPYVLIPATVLGRGQLHTVAYNSERGEMKPSDLNGKKFGVRSYTQTTGIWVRGILAEDYGVDWSKVEIVTMEDPHVAQYKDPPFVKRAPETKQLPQMLIDGEIDAALIGDKFPDPRFKTLVPNAQEASRKWAESHGGVPVNHMIVLRETIARERPDVVEEVFRVFREARALDTAAPKGILDPYRFGVEAVRKSLEKVIDYSFKQQMIPRKITVDELFDDITRKLV
jgi:4,5-dihydroxyphthalate decarboxylase